jgi:hypothetical protein
VLRVTGFRNVKLQLRAGCLSLVGTETRDISSRGWGGIHFRLVEDEEERVRLECRDLEVIEAECLPPFGDRLRRDSGW